MKRRATSNAGGTAKQHRSTADKHNSIDPGYAVAVLKSRLQTARTPEEQMALRRQILALNAARAVSR